MDICRHSEFCGGCSFQGMNYETELKQKEKMVLDLLESKKIKIDKIDSIVASPNLKSYRNKMEYTFGDMVKDGELTLGMHQKGRFWSVVTVDNCQLIHDDFNKILRGTLDFAINSGYKKYNKKSHEGLLRNLIIRRGERTNQILINIVTTPDEDGVFDEAYFVEMIKNLPLENEVVGILRTLNSNKSDAVRPEAIKILEGRDYYEEEILGIKFKVGAFSFFQTNISAVENLYRSAIDLVPNVNESLAFDLFCGTGTITQALAQRAKRVIGVEIVEEAVEFARKSAEYNNLTNCEFICGDVFKVMEELHEKPDFIMVDPPRKGIEPKALDKIISYGIDNIVYISCNPKSLVENLYYLEYNGYKATHLKIFDNFPRTGHVEALTLLSRRRKQM